MSIALRKVYPLAHIAIACLLSIAVAGCDKQGKAEGVPSAPAPIQDQNALSSYLAGEWCFGGDVQGTSDLTKIVIDKSGKHFTAYYRLGAYSRDWGKIGSGPVNYGVDRDTNSGQVFLYAQMGETALTLIKFMPAVADGTVVELDGANPSSVGHQDCSRYN